MEVASGLAGGTLMTVAGQTMLAVAGQTMADAPSVIVIGAGLPGIAMAHELKYNLGFDDFVIYEKQDQIRNSVTEQKSSNYRSRFPVALHSFSFNQNYRWENHYATDNDIQAYLNDTVDRFDLRQHIHTSVEMVQAQWIDDKNIWCVRLRDLQTEVEFNRYCTILISAVSWENAAKYSTTPDSGFDQPISTISAWANRYIPLIQRLRRLQSSLHAETSGERAWSKTSGPDQEDLQHAELNIIGARDGVSLSKYWEETRRPQAYWGCLVASFPNFGLVLGPKSYSIFNSPFVAIETSVSYLSRNLVSPILDNRAARVEVRQTAEDCWTSNLDISTARYERRHSARPSYMVWPFSMAQLYVQGLLYGSRGLVYKNGQTGWWMNTFVRWTKSIRLKTWLVILLMLVSLRLKTVKTRVERARADVEKYVPYEKQVIEVANKLKDNVLK